VQVLPQIERLARLELDVAVVRKKLPHRPDAARPLAGAEKKVDGARASGVGALGPDEHLRHEQDGASGVLALHVQQGADELVALLEPAATARAGRHVENAGRALQEQ